MVRKIHAEGCTINGMQIGVCGQYIAPAYEPANNYDYVTCKKCIRKLGIEKPTVEQVAWVFRKIIENANRGTFRYLIYDLMGFDESAYEPLYLAGGMAINNAFVADDDKDRDE